MSQPPAAIRPRPILGIRAADLRGATRLAHDATLGLADLVEALHERIGRLPGLPAPAAAGRTRGITGLVYKTVRGVTRLVGGGLDSLLALLAAAVDTPPSPHSAPLPQREALLAALNGVLGDHLASSANPLAITMALRQHGQPLPLSDAAALAASVPDAAGDVLVAIHGLCMNDLQWTHRGHNHALALAADTGFSPVFAHYNSGLAIAANGLALARQLEALATHWPQPLRRLVLIGHSMGGLVARSAFHQGSAAGHTWPARVSELVFLGTPHHGAPLERAGHWIDTVLEATPYAAPFARLGKLRSAGIVDLRHGHVMPGKPRSPPLPVGVRSFAIASTLGQQPGNLKGRLLGDGLVPLASALGQHRDPARRLAFAADQQRVVDGIGHLELLGSPAVHAQLKTWLADPAPR
jgi:PGAP1-like protein